MRAWQLSKNGEPEEVLQLVEKDVPEPGPGEILIRVEAVSLGLPDVFLCRGNYVFHPLFPFTPGQEVVGIVTATGEGTSTAIGSRVMAITNFIMGPGGFADQTLAQDTSAYRVPDEMPKEDAAAFLIPFQTAYIALTRRAHLSPGETLLVHGGAGGVGSATIQVGHALGAKVIATDVGSEKVKVCRELGAHVAVDGSKEDFVEVVRQNTEGRGADVIFDTVGGDVFTISLNCIANEGRILTIGFASGKWQTVSTEDILLRNCSVVGSLAAFYDKEFMDRQHEEILKLYAGGHIKPLIKRKISFEDIPRALTDLAKGKMIGKVIAIL